MIRMGVTLLLTSSFAVLCRIADFALFSGLLIKVICLTALSCSFGLFIAALGIIEYKRHHRHPSIHAHSSQGVMQVVHAGARV